MVGIQLARLKNVSHRRGPSCDSSHSVQRHTYAGKTQIWKQGGEKPPGCDALTTDAQQNDPNVVVWKGDRTLLQDQQGLIVLGTPLGSAEFVQRELAELSVKHQSLLDRIPHVQDLQSAWLLLLFCAVPRPNYFLRVSRGYSGVRCATRQLRQEVFGTAAPHNHPRRYMARGHIAIGFGSVGFAERFKRPAGVVLVQLG